MCPTSNSRDGILRRQTLQRQLQPAYVDIVLCSSTERRQSVVELPVPRWYVWT
jgi:hypothetical protein